MIRGLMQRLLLAEAMLAIACPLLRAQVAVSFTTFPAGTTTARDIVRGPDDRIWYTDPNAANVRRLGPPALFPIPTGEFSWSIARGADGVWFSTRSLIPSFKAETARASISTTMTQVGRLTTGGALTSYEFDDFSDQAEEIVIGPDGNAWFTLRSDVGLGRISPAGTFTDFLLDTCCRPSAIAVGPDNAIWYTTISTVGRINTDGSGWHEYPLLNRSAAPVAITAGPDGALWIAETSQITRMTTAGVITHEFHVAAGVNDIVVGADGALWYTRTTNVLGLGRMTTAGAKTEWNTPGDSTADSHLTVGADNAIWFTRGSVIVRASTDTLSSSPTSLSFFYRVNGPFPEPQTVRISSSGSTPIFVNASVQPPAAWLSIVPSSGNTPLDVTASVDPLALSPGVYSTQIEAAGDAANGTVVIPVTLTVAAPLQVTAAPASVTFVSVGRSAPEPQRVQVKRPGGDQLSLHTQMAAAPSALQLLDSGGDSSPVWTTSALVPSGTGDVMVNLRINPAVLSSLPYGTYSGSLDITPGPRPSSTLSVPVTLEMRPLTLTVTGQCATPIVGETMSIPMLVTGGRAPFTVALSAPAGFSAVPSGGSEMPFRTVVSGVPSAVGPLSVVATITDADGAAGVYRCDTYAGTRYVPPVSLSTATCPSSDATLGTAISLPLAASGGTGVYTFNSLDLPPGLRISGNSIAGTPSEAGSFTYTLTASSSGAQSAEVRCALRVLPSPLKIATSCPTATRQGDRYYFPIAASGGLGGVSYEISITGLPPGLFATRGGIQGTATEQGVYSLQIQVRSGDQTVTQSCPMTVNDPSGRPPGPRATMTCPTDPVPSGAPVSVGISVSGGAPPYRFSASAPDWLQLSSGSSSATLFGTAGPPGTYPVTASISDANGSTQVSCNVVVIEPPLVLTGPTCPATAAVGASLDLPFSASGGPQPYQWQLSSGPGLSLTSTSGPSTRVTGAPSEPGPLNVSTSVTDAAGNSRRFQCTIEAVVVPLSISAQGCPTTPLIRPANVSVALTGAGGRGGYSWSLSGPSFLSMNPASGPAVTVTGAPAGAGEFSFSATLSDQANSPRATYTCRITVPPVTAPDVQLSGLTISTNPAESNDLELMLSAPSSVPLTATVVLSFTPNVALPGVTDNPLVQFTNGKGRSITVTIPPGQTKVPLGARVNVGNIAGIVRLTVSTLLDGEQQILGSNLPAGELLVQRAAPVLESVSFVAGGVVVRGFSNTLDMQSVTLTFNPATDATIDGPSTFTFSSEVQQYFRDFYQNRVPSAGSAFEVRFPVTLGGAVDAVASVTVNFRNSAGETTGQAALR